MKRILFVFWMLWAVGLSGQEARLVLPVGHTGYINSAVFSPDYKYVLTSGGIAKLWDIASGRELISLEESTGSIETAVFSTDSKHIMTSSLDGSVSIWDYNTGNMLKTFKGHEKKINSAVYSFNNKYILTSSNDSTFCVWDAESIKEIRRIKGHQGYVNSAFYSSDNKLLLTASNDKTIRIWSSETGEELKRFEGHQAGVTSAMFNSENKQVLSVSRDNTVRVWDVSTGDELVKLEDHDGVVKSAIFSYDDKYIIMSSNNSVRIYELSGKEIMNHDLYTTSTVQSTEKKFLLSVSKDEAIIWNFQTGEIIKRVGGKTVWVTDNIICSDQSSVLTVSGDSSIHLWSILNAKEQNRFMGHNGWLISATFSNNNKLVLTTSADKTARLWDRQTGVLLKELNLHKDIVNSAVFSEDNKLILTASKDKTARIWEVETGKEIKCIKGHKGNIYSAVFSSDNKVVLTAAGNKIRRWDPDTGKELKFSEKNQSNDFTARLWKVENGKELKRLVGHKSNVISAMFSPNNKFILTTSMDNTAIIWEVKTAKKLFEIKEISLPYNYKQPSAIFSYDSKFLTTISNDNYVSIWDVKTGKEVSRLKGHYDKINSVIHNKNNKLILTSSSDKTVKLWDFEKGLQIKSLAVNSVNSAFFTSDDKKILTTGSDHKTILWDAATGKALYTRLQLKNGDWLVYDEHYRYDGSQGARDYLYFVCGLEVVDLAQVKDALYVPNLVQRIMNGENLDHLPKLKDLEICGVTPEVEPLDNKKDGGNYYQIKARKGGVGKVEIYINGMLRQTLDSKTISQKDGIYELKIEEKLIQQYQIADKETEIKVVARTADNKISSRGSVAKATVKESVIRKPQMYAIMVGIDDYKGSGLDLNYAAKDAIDLQTALKISTQKLFNVDDTNRVHFYNLTLDRSGNINGLTPDRNNILKTLEKIEKESKPEDVFMLFFAGHGEINPDKQLILLTAEASKEQAPNYSGILMKELLEKLAKIPAGKRILLLDACHSGAAINELNIKDIAGVRDGEDAEKQSQRLKELENLASKSGLAIITASSTDQKALELPQYEHGLMTYALLTTMLNDPEVLDKDNNLQLEDWLRQTEKNVSKLIENQSAQRFVPVNFSVGKVDDAVRKSIVLQEIPTVVVANVMNLETGDDDQDIETKLVKKLNEISTRGGTEKIIIAKEDGPNAISVNLSYELSEGKIKSKITLKKEKKVFKQFNFEDSSADLNKFVEELSKEITKNLK